jgi:hypothetical protein
MLKNNPRKVRVFNFYNDIIVGVANSFIQNLNEITNYFFIELLVNCELGKIYIFNLLNLTFNPLFLHMLSRAFEHSMHVGQGELRLVCSSPSNVRPFGANI